VLSARRANWTPEDLIGQLGEKRMGFR